jgi:uncharacterized membrane protein
MPIEMDSRPPGNGGFETCRVNCSVTKRNRQQVRVAFCILNKLHSASDEIMCPHNKTVLRSFHEKFWSTSMDGRSDLFDTMAGSALRKRVAMQDAQMRYVSVAQHCYGGRLAI